MFPYKVLGSDKILLMLGVGARWRSTPTYSVGWAELANPNIIYNTHDEGIQTEIIKPMM